MSKREEMLEGDLTTARSKLEKVEEENRELRYELAHYRTAVAAVRWLWERAAE